MSISTHSGARLLLPAALLLLALLPAAGAPFNIYLTYPDNPSTSITVNFSLPGDAGKTPGGMVKWCTSPHGGDASAYPHTVETEKRSIAELPDKRTLHRANLLELAPDTTYYFIVGDEQGFSEERSFHTIPASDAPLRFVTGGDMNVLPLTERLLEQAGKQDPAFCAVGGDIAYVNGRVWQYETWDKWFSNYDRYMRTSDGRMIPMFVAIGNHETNDYETEVPKVRAPFYMAFFGEPQAGDRTYFMRKFGSNIAFLALDSGHVAPHGGAQAAWLAETLSETAAIPYRFAIYHVPLYPSMRPYEGEGSRLGRLYWEPYFDAFNLTTAFENHDHTLKRSKLLSHGQPDEAGVLYLGDGCFGVNPRQVEPELRPYLEHQEGVGHIWVVDVSTAEIHYRALGDQGQTLDEYVHHPK